LLEHALGCSRLVLMNEAHDGLSRCVRTREVGREVLPVAHRLGVRHLAMEALWQAAAGQANAARRLADGLFGYLGQPEMQALIERALHLGWTLHAYEAELATSPHGNGPEDGAAINWREDQQARNLGAVVAGLSGSARILCWCGNGHLTRQEGVAIEGERFPWTPMGSLIARYCGVEPFAIDQTRTVEFGGKEREWLAPFVSVLRAHGGTAGFLAGDEPAEFPRVDGAVDAYLLSLDNALVE
jgi:hypothetical protein